MRQLDKPKVFLVQQPAVNKEGMRAYLEEIEDDEGNQAVSWLERLEETGVWDTLPDASTLIEFMGRLCYKSWVPNLNKNVTKIREDHDDYVLNILQAGHGSVISHAHFSFAIRGGSRVFTAEMNRHQVGTDISEQSLRFVRLDNLEMWLPPGLHQQTYEDGSELIEQVERFISRAYEREFTEDMPFSEKKKITSKLRRWVPMGIATEEGWTGSVRAIRHILEMRTDFHAEEEIRLIIDQMGKIMVDALPAFFQDYTCKYNPGNIDGDWYTPQWTTEFRKV